MNARFWIWYTPGECWVRLTLRPGQATGWTWGGPNDEGYSYSHEAYSFDGWVVTYKMTTNACDCDGRLDSHSEVECPLGLLRSRDVFADCEMEYCRGIMAPEWTPVRSGQRDYAAEAAGY